MKLKICFLIAVFGALAVLVGLGTKQEKVEASPPAPLVASPLHEPAGSLEPERTAAQPGTRVVAQRRAQSYPISPEVAGQLALTDREGGVLNRLFQQKRAAVLREFAKHSQLAKLGDSGVQVAVAMPKEQADALRAGFYADMAEIIGQERLARFMGTENLGRFEAHFEFFGTLPMVYEFEGDRTLLARSEVVNFRTNVARSDQYGPYNSYIAGKYGLSEFQREFGAVADLAISQQPSS